MQPQSPTPPEAIGITARLAGLASDVDGQLADPTEHIRRLVDALTQQLAAGQVETLYGLHSAAAAVGRRVTDLERAADALPEGLSCLFTEVSTDVASAALLDISEALATGQEALATRLASLGTEFAASMQAELMSARTASDAASRLSAETLKAGERALADALDRVSEQVEEEKTTFDDAGANLRAEAAAITAAAASATRLNAETFAAGEGALAGALGQLHTHVEEAKTTFGDAGANLRAEAAAITAAAAAATTLNAENLAAGADALAGALGELRASLEDAKGTFRDTRASLRAEAAAITAEMTADISAALTERFAQVEADLRTVAAEVLTDVEHAADRFVSEASEVTRGMTSFGEAFIGRLVTTLDERDKRDQLLEDRLTARVDRLTKKTADSVTRLTDSLAEQFRSLEERDLSQQRTAVQDLQALLERVLAEPRGKLKAMRASTREPQGRSGRTPTEDEDST